MYEHHITFNIPKEGMTVLNDFDGRIYIFFDLHIIIFFIESLFGCCDDCGICCFGCVAPAFLFGENIEKIDGTNCVVAYCAYSLLCDTCTCCCYHFYKRRVLRKRSMSFS